MYADDPLDQPSFQAGEKFLMNRFPNFDKMTGTMLLQSLLDKGFTKQRFKDAIKYVFENYEYANFVPAVLLNYDKVLDLKTNLQIMELAKTFGTSIWLRHQAIDVNGTCMFVEKGKMEQHKIHFPLWKAEHYKPVEPLTDKQIEAVKETFDFKKVAEEVADKIKRKVAKKSKYQGMRLTAEEIVAEAEKRKKN